MIKIDVVDCEASRHSRRGFFGRALGGFLAAVGLRAEMPKSRLEDFVVTVMPSPHVTTCKAGYPGLKSAGVVTFRGTWA